MADENLTEHPDPVLIGWKLKERNETEWWVALTFVGVFDYGPDEESGEPTIDEHPDFKLNVNVDRDNAPPVSLGEVVGLRWDFAP